MLGNPNSDQVLLRWIALLLLTLQQASYCWPIPLQRGSYENILLSNMDCKLSSRHCMWFGCHVMDEDSWRHFKAFCCPVAKIELFESPKKFTKSLPVYMKEFLSFICSHLGFGKNIKGANKIIAAIFLLIHICESCQWQ